MHGKTILLLLALTATADGAVAAALSFARPAIIPAPSEMTFESNVVLRLDAEQDVTVRCPEAAAAVWVRDHLRLWFAFEPKVAGRTEAVALPEEGYRLSARPEGIVVEAKTLAGVRYALFTLRQIAERNSEGATVTGYRLPACTIEDAPTLRFRGVHFCWMPEMSADFVEREIRLAAAYKFNTVVLEPWGVYRSERHPWFGWPEGMMTKEAIARLVVVARDLGVTLVPQFNVFGHASASRSCTGKHAALDFGPERQCLFEPGGSWSSGWNWCLSNPEAVRTVRELVVEMHEAFGNPPYFHIGCDEADAPSCASCRGADYSVLVAAHITEIARILKARGTRTMMWHDMLLRSGDPRWKGFYANGSAATAKLVETLPKDIIVCDWYYGNDAGGQMAEKDRKSLVGTYPTLDYFAKTCGFDTVTCPWEERGGIRAQAKYACEQGLFGVLETTWHHFGGERFPDMIQLSSCGAWGRGEKRGRAHFATVWRQCGWDMKAPSYRESGWYDTQVSRDILTR